MNYEAGSQWRKWDLHFHTPTSFDYKNNARTNADIIAGLKKHSLSAVAITDHHFIDVARIKELQKLAAPDLTIFPGIELRSELGGSESVHFIGIFPENCDLQDVWTKLSGRLNITPADVTSKGNDRVYCDFVEAADCIHELGGIVSAHAGKKTNSIENINNAEKFKQAVKQDLARKAIDIFEIGKIADIEDYRKIVFPFLNREYPLVLCSDNHDIATYEVKANLWIKADTTFEGLKQVTIEPSERIFVGDIPPKLLRVAEQKTKYIQSIEIRKRAGSPLRESWFDSTLTLNPGLVAIIGNKGKGKSALTDTIGLLGNTKQSRACSFLTEKGFKNPRDNKAKHFDAKMTWLSGDSQSASLDSPADENKPELVKYIPQNFLETICNEIGGQNESNFDRELKKVIFSHVSEEDRLGKASLDELIKYKTEEANDTIALLKEDLHLINEEIVSLESQSRPEFKQNIEGLLALKRAALESHLGSKPALVAPPQNDPANQAAIALINADITSAKQKRDEFEQQLQAAREERNKQTLQLAAIDKLVSKLENFNRQYETFKADCQVELQVIGVAFEDIVKFTIDRTQLNTKKTSCTSAKKKADEQLDPTYTLGAAFKKADIEKKIAGLQVTLDEPNKKYQAYISALETWEKGRLKILGDDATPSTIAYYEKQLNDLKAVPARLATSKKARMDKAKAIHAEIRALADAYRSLYAPVHKFIQDRPLARDKFHLNFDVAIIDTGFESEFFSIISRAISGTFYGSEEGAKALQNILARHDFSTEAGIETFLGEIMESLDTDRRWPEPTPVDIQTLLRKDMSLIDLYDTVFSLDYLRPRYMLRMADKELNQLSPGERGTLLLVFYLLIDKGDIPLIIDQPEENLDNQTVYELLVPCIKEAKERRQIFIVTHNPNLAVVCDAEQIVVALLDKPNNQRMEYVSGAIENPRINKLVLDVLEGTRPAFDNRDSKYSLGA